MDSSNCIDIAVIGGGIHGCAIAAEAASRGLTVELFEAHDLAWGGSSHSNCRIGADLRLLERLNFEAVADELSQQAELMRLAPHLCHSRWREIVAKPALRSQIKVKAGLYAYRQLQRRAGLPVTPPEGAKSIGFIDAISDGSRLSVACAQLAQHLGAKIYRNHRLCSAVRTGEQWRLEIQARGQMISQHCRILINAGGVQLNQLMDDVIDHTSRSRAQAISELQLLIQRDTPLPCQLLQAESGELVYCTPIRTSELGLQAASAHYALVGPWPLAAADQCDIEAQSRAEAALQQLLREHDLGDTRLLRHWWTHRSVCEDSSCADSASILDLDSENGAPPLVNVFGGNLVTHRLVAKRCLDILRPFSGRDACAEFASQALAGGDFGTSFKAWFEQLRRDYSDLPRQLLARLAGSYGSSCRQLLGTAQGIGDLGKDFGAGLYQREVEYLMQYEWAESAEDILWRRGKLGIVFTPEQVDQLQRWMSAQ